MTITNLKDGSALRAWRTRMGLSQQQAAEALFIPLNTYKSLETGRRDIKPAVSWAAFMLESRKSEPGVVPSDSPDCAIHVIGGGTVSYIRNHFAFCAPAYGTTAKEIVAACGRHGRSAALHLTRMADPASALETNEDVGNLIDGLVSNPAVRIVFMNAALCDFDGTVEGMSSGRHAQRLKTREGSVLVTATPAEKVIGKLRRTRKDIFAVGFKVTTGASADEQYITALNLLKANSLNLVMANDVVTRLCMVVAPEEARYHVTKNRAEAIEGMVEMALLRSANTFTRSTVISGNSVPWQSDVIPDNLRTVIEHCIQKRAYKPFRGVTAGHFASRMGESGSLKSIVTSKRKHDFNKLPDEGMVRVDYREGSDAVIAHGFKPSVGGQSQRIIFEEHPDADCIVHFHCPMREDAADPVPHRSQREVECGSHQCGSNTSQGLRKFGNLKAVMLDGHGPNVVFSRNTSPDEVIGFIERNFDLSDKTGGHVS